jgi:hypothetical protein
VEVSRVPLLPIREPVVVARALAPIKDWAGPEVVIQEAVGKLRLRVTLPPVRLEAGVLLLLLAPRNLPTRSPSPEKRTPRRVPRDVSNLSKSCVKVLEVDRVDGVRAKSRLANALNVLLEIV